LNHTKLATAGVPEIMAVFENALEARKSAAAEQDGARAAFSLTLANALETAMAMVIGNAEMTAKEIMLGVTGVDMVTLFASPDVEPQFNKMMSAFSRARALVSNGAPKVLADIQKQHPAFLVIRSLPKLLGAPEMIKNTVRMVLLVQFNDKVQSGLVKVETALQASAAVMSLVRSFADYTGANSYAKAVNGEPNSEKKEGVKGTDGKFQWFIKCFKCGKYGHRQQFCPKTDAAKALSVEAPAKGQMEMMAGMAEMFAQYQAAKASLEAKAAEEKQQG